MPVRSASLDAARRRPVHAVKVGVAVWMMVASGLWAARPVGGLESARQAGNGSLAGHASGTTLALESLAAGRDAPAGAAIATPDREEMAPRVTELGEPLRRQALSDPCTLTEGRPSKEFALVSGADGEGGGSGLGLRTEARLAPGRIALSALLPTELTVEILGEWVLRAVAGGTPGTARIEHVPAALVRVSLAGIVVRIVSHEELLHSSVRVDLAGIGELVVAERPRAPGSASPAIVAADGTFAAAALDVVRLRLLPSPAAVGGLVDARIGHLEASASVSGGGITCTSGEGESTAVWPRPGPGPSDAAPGSTPAARQPQAVTDSGPAGAAGPEGGEEVLPLPASPPPDPAPGLLVAGTGGKPEAPPGAAFHVSGAGYDRCSAVDFRFDGRHIGSLRPDRAGEIEGELTVPATADPGPHVISAECLEPGYGEAASAFAVTAVSVHRSAFVLAVPRLAAVELGAEAVLRSVITTFALVLLVAFPAELFNSTLNEHYGEVRRWFGLPSVPNRRTSRRGPGPLLLFLLAGGLLDALLNPGLGLDLSSAVLVVALVASLATVTFGLTLPALVRRRRRGERAAIVVMPGTLLVAAACVAVSRLARFQPGYLYGALAGFERAPDEDGKEAGRVTAIGFLVVLLISLAAWMALPPVSAVASGEGAGAAAIFVEALLATTFLVGLETTAIGLLPLRFLEGEKVWQWNRRWWAVLFCASAFAFVHILLTPRSGFVGTSPLGRAVVVTLFAAFGAASVAFWAYFRFRARASVR